MIFIFEFLLSDKYFIVSFTNIFAHQYFGKPDIPALIAGIDILLNSFCGAVNLTISL